jgi:hypothetical protein
VNPLGCFEQGIITPAISTVPCIPAQAKTKPRVAGLVNSETASA